MKNKEKTKIELKKETSSNGEIRYCIYINNEFITSSCYEPKALEKYEIIKKNKAKKKEKILKSEEI